jgi:hypothetical protein
MNCSKSTGGKLYPIDDIASIMPEAVINSIDVFNTIPCRLSENSYCTKSKCFFDQPVPDSIPASCSCSLYTLLANMYMSTYNSTYCLITNQTNVVYSMNTQEVRVVIVQENGNIENVNININQVMQVKIASLTSTSVQTSIADVCYENINYIMESSADNPEYFNDEVSQGLTQSYESINKETLKDIVVVNVKQTIQSMTRVDQTITIFIKNSTWTSLQLNLNQETIVQVIAQNIASISVTNITKEILKENFQDLQFVIGNTYCKKPSSNYYYLLLLFLLLIPIYITKKYITSNRRLRNEKLLQQNRKLLQSSFQYST